jgi:hypothetical protein
MMSEVHYLLERSSEPDLPFHPDRCWRGVCPENLDSDVVVMKSAKDGT